MQTKDIKKLNKNERASLIKKARIRKPINAPIIEELISEDTISEKESSQIFLEKIKDIHTSNIKLINEMDSNIDYVKVALTEAEEIWLKIQILIQTDRYSKMTDDQKVNLIQTNFSDFYKNFPIVSRYMVCVGKYNLHAFKKMLVKCHESKDKKDKTDKDSNQKMWIMQQSDYIRFLWESTQGPNFDQASSDTIWKETHTALTDEFKQFKDMHDAAEEKVKLDAIKYKKELLYEMGERLISGSQELNDESAKKLLNKLMDKLYKQRSNKVLKHIIKINPDEIAIESFGLNIDQKNLYDEELQQSFYKKTYKKMDINKIIQ